LLLSRPTWHTHSHLHPTMVMFLICLLSGSVHARSGLLSLLTAEFALERQQIPTAVNLYRQEALRSQSSTVLERALVISMNAEYLDDSITIAKYWTQMDPNHIPALFYLAHLALRQHHYPLAAQTLDQILRYDPDAALDRILIGIYPDNPTDRQALLTALNQIDSKHNPSLLVMTAGLLAQSGQLELALAKVNQALQTRPNVTAFITLKANIMLQQQRYAEVSQWLMQQTRKQSNNKSLRLFEVRYLLNQQDQQQALQRLDQMARKWPQDGEIMLLAALVSIDQQRSLDAEKYLLQLLTQDAYIDQAYYYLGINAERLNRTEVAEVYFQKVQSDDLYRKAQKKLALLRVSTGRLDEALSALTQERVDHPNQAVFLYLLQAQLLRESQQSSLARRILDEALVSHPEEPELIYHRLLVIPPHETALIEAELEHLLVLEPDNPTYLNAYAFALAEQNRRLADARILAERANSLMPNQPPILDTLGYVLLRQGEYTEASNILRSAYQTDQSLNIGLRLADALHQSQQLDDYQQLIKDLQQRYAGDPRLDILSPTQQPIIKSMPLVKPRPVPPLSLRPLHPIYASAILY
jgi:predicted Zn-dependent protease